MRATMKIIIIKIIMIITLNGNLNHKSTNMMKNGMITVVKNYHQNYYQVGLCLIWNVQVK